MTTIGQITREYREAGAVNRLLALWGFVDEGTFLTKAGHVGVAYRVKGIDAETLTHAQRQSFTHRIEAALRSLNEHCRVYQYLVKRTARSFVSQSCAQRVAHEAIQRRTAYLNGRRAELYDLAAYAVLMYEPPAPARGAIGLRHSADRHERFSLDASRGRGPSHWSNRNSIVASIRCSTRLVPSRRSSGTSLYGGSRDKRRSAFSGSW